MANIRTTERKRVCPLLPSQSHADTLTNSSVLTVSRCGECFRLLFVPLPPVAARVKSCPLFLRSCVRLSVRALHPLNEWRYYNETDR